MQPGRWRRTERMVVWLVAAGLCVLAADAPLQGSGAADGEALVAPSNSLPTASPRPSSGNAGTPSDLFVPVILTASGASDSYYTSELTLTNRGSQAATLRYTYTPAAGGGNGTASETLAPGRQKILPNAIDYLRSLGVPIPPSGNRIGTLRVGVSGSSEVSVTARTTTRVAGGRAGLAYPGVALADGFSEAVYLCGLRQNRRDRSNVAFQNMGASGNITVRATVFSGDSGDSRVLPEVVLPPGGFRQLNGVLATAGYTQGYVRAERVSGAAPFYAYGVINDQANSDGSFVFPVTESLLEGVQGQTLPVIIEHPNFSSELIVTNFSNSTRAVDFGFVAEGIATEDGTARFTLTLAGGEQRILPAIVAHLRRQGVEGLGPAGRTLAGAVFATERRGDLSGVVIGARTGSPGGGGQYSVFYNGVPHGAAFDRTAWIDALQQNQENRSNLALVNTGETDGSESVFELEIYDGDTGQLANTVTGIRVPARGWNQINGILGKYAPGAAQGYVQIQRISGNNPFLAYGVINDGGAPGQRSGDGAYLPAREGIIDPGSGEVTDREVLEALYHATGGPAWNNRTNWLSATPLGDWFGVGTDGNGRVTSLALPGNGLSGSIPPVLGQLASLEQLILWNNQLGGSIPPELAALSELQGLSLGNNQLSGSIPIELGRLSNLQWLVLSINRLSGPVPPELGRLSNLRELVLGDNQLGGSIPAELGRLSNLRRLLLSNSQLAGRIPQSLVQLSQLETLSIISTRICVPTGAAFQAWLGTISTFESSGLACDGSLRISFSASSYEVREGESVEVTVRMIDQTEGPPPSATISITATPGGGATGTDYSGVPGRVTITAPASAATFPVTAVKDSHYDHAETIVLSFARPLPSGITTQSPDTATVTIIDPGSDGMTDKEVLEALYDVTGGPTAWSDRSNWLSAAPLGDWFGVGTDGNGRVTSLALPGNGLSGPIPPVLGQLDYLERLELGARWDPVSGNRFDNQLSGPIPTELAALANLRELDLSFNQLSGSVPTELAALATLQQLVLSDNQLSGSIPTALGRLAALRGLYLHFNQLSGSIPPELAALANLQSLYLGGNQLTGPIPAELGRLADLRELYLSFNQLSGSIPPELAALATLQRLSLGGNQLSGSIPTELGRLADLRELGLAANQLSGSIPIALGRLANLRELGLGFNQLSGSIPPELAALPNLQRLYLGVNQLSGSIPAEIGALSNLQQLFLSGNQLSGSIPPELAALPKLRELDFSFNQLSGSIPPELGALASLERLDLGANQLSGSIPPELAALSNLQRLDLGFNPDLTGTIPTRLQQLPLGNLSLMATAVCAPQDATFQAWLTTIEFLASGLICGGSPDAMSLIDVAVFFTPAARRQAGGKTEIESLIDLWVAETNQAYQDSGVKQRIGLAARQEVDYQEENGSGGRALARLENRSDGYMDEVHGIRDRTGADLVHLIADVTDVAGIANLPGAFGVTCVRCASVLFAHELGHNMGLSHDRYVAGGSGLLPYSHGYVNQRAFAAGSPEARRWRTIMSYYNQCWDADVVCDPILRFSNPDQVWLGDPLGVPGDQRTEAVAGPADAVRTLNLTRHSVASFRPRASVNRLTISSIRSRSRSAARTGPAPAPVPGGGLFQPLAVSSTTAVLRGDGGLLDRAGLRHRQVSVDITRLDGVPDGRNTALILNLFDDLNLTVIIQRRASTYSGGYALSGSVYGIPGGRATLVVNGSLVAGTVRIPGATYRIRPAAKGSHAIVQVDPSQLSWRCGTEP